MRGQRIIKIVIGSVLGIALALSCCFASTYTPYTDGTPSSTYVNWLQGVMANRDGDYVLWRDSQYVYRIAFGDIDFDGGNIFAGDVELATIQTSSGYNSQSSLVFSSDASFRLDNSQNAIIFSNLGGYPDICDVGGKRYEIQAIIFGIAVLSVYLLVDGIFRAVRRFG